MTVVEDLEEVATLLGGEWGEAPVVEDEQIDAREGLEQPDIAAVAAGERVDAPAKAEADTIPSTGPPPELLTTGGAVRPFIGTLIRRVRDADRTALSMPDMLGALVVSAEDGAPAAQAGLRPNDVIRKVDGIKSIPVSIDQELIKELELG